MEQRRNSRQKGGSGTERKELLSVLLIPFTVIILIVIIVIADRGKPSAAPESAVESGTPAVYTKPEAPESGGEVNESEPEESVQPESETVETEAGDGFETDTLRRDSIPEVLDLMKKYFVARADGDAETMNRLYGVGEVSGEAFEEQKTRMRSNAKYVQGFENVATYIRQGTTPDSWLVYALADIRFHSVNTAAPMIMWCYVKKGPEGDYQIVDNESLSENELQFVDVSNHSEEVRRLASSVNVKLKEALKLDEELGSVYGVLRDGSPVYEEGENGQEVVIN